MYMAAPVIATTMKNIDPTPTIIKFVSLNPSFSFVDLIDSLDLIGTDGLISLNLGAPYIGGSVGRGC